MLKPGNPAPDFTLPDAEGNEVSLGSILADGPAIVYFYPVDASPACTAQACMVRDLHDELAEAGLRVVGISPQPPKSKQKFARNRSLNFTLLSDTSKDVAKRYGATWPMGIAFRRVTYLVDADGTIADGITSDFSVSRHKAFIKRAIGSAGPSRTA